MLNTTAFPEFHQLCRRFETEEACEKALIQAKWPEGFCCPRCGQGQAYLVKTRRLTLFQCKSCRHQTTAIAGTIMEGSRTPLRKWFQAIILHAYYIGPNAKTIANFLQVTYKTAWHICHKIRHAMSHAESRELLTGIVRIQSAYYRRDARSPLSKYFKTWKCPVIAAASISRSGKIMEMRIRKLDKKHVHGLKVHRAAVKSLLKRHVDPATPYISSFPNLYCKDRNPAFNLTIMQACSWINYTFSGGIGEKHLQAYLDQSCFVREARDWAATIHRLLKWCAVAPRLTYAALVGREHRTIRRSNPRERMPQAIVG